MATSTGYGGKERSSPGDAARTRARRRRSRERRRAREDGRILNGRLKRTRRRIELRSRPAPRARGETRGVETPVRARGRGQGIDVGGGVRSGEVPRTVPHVARQRGGEGRRTQDVVARGRARACGDRSYAIVIEETSATPRTRRRGARRGTRGYAETGTPAHTNRVVSSETGPGEGHGCSLARALTDPDEVCRDGY